MLRSPARLLAPLALVVCAVAILVIVNGNPSGSGGPKTSSTKTGSTTTTAKHPATKHRRTYRVKPGDVLSRIAVKTGVPLETIQRLNPSVDAQSLHAGQQLKLAP